MTTRPAQPDDRNGAEPARTDGADSQPRQVRLVEQQPEQQPEQQSKQESDSLTSGEHSISDSQRTRRHDRLLVLGANGPTGRRTVEQALDRGYHVAALTRHPETFPIQHERLDVIAGDATNASVIDVAVADTDAVICTIGAAFTRRPVDVYSTSARLLVEAMGRHGKSRLLVVTSGGLSDKPRGGRIAQKLFEGVMRNYVGKTVYDDMALMETLVSASDLDWTIVRPPGLTDEPGTGYAVAEDAIDGGFCSREDLAAMLLDQLDDTTFVGKVAAMATPGLRVGAGYMIRHEILKR